MKYQANRGGHAPDHLRQALQDWLDDDSNPTEITVIDAIQPVEWLLGQLWNCRDVLPASYCEALDLPQGSTYAQAVRHIKRHGTL